jgi:orotidine-5'-phosphate decarboxylase
MLVKKKIIIALDFKTKEEAISLARSLDPALCNLKVGSQLFTASGPQVVYELKKLGFDIFLDLKFHDIPNTVYGAVQAALSMGIWMLNVHISGGTEMMRSARLAVSKEEVPPLLIGVTILTSLSKEEASELGIDDVKLKVMDFAKLAKVNKLDGIVCSPREIIQVKKELGDDFMVVTPGIRLQLLQKDDQKRISTAQEAITNGADFIVLGRPITLSNNPNKALEELLAQI